MKHNERLWRTLADAALEGRREWPDVMSLADAADLTNGNAHHALRRLVDIGAVRVRRRGGLTVLSPEKLLIQLSAYRSLVQDTIAITTPDCINELLARDPGSVTIGGADAAVHWLGGNTVASIGTRLVYVDADAPTEFPAGDAVRVVVRDGVGRRSWSSGYTSLAQTYADLFAQPGWQATEFRRALHDRLFSDADWDQRAQPHG